MIARGRIVASLAGAAVVAVLGVRALAQQPQPPQPQPQPPAQPIQAPVQQPAAKPAAVVNGEPVALADVMAVLSQQPPPANPLTEAQKRELQQTAVNMLVEDLLMKQFLRKNAAPAPPAEIEKEVAELVEALKKDKQTLQEFLKDSQQTEEQLRAHIAASLQWRAYVTPQLPEPKIKAYYDANKVFFDKVFVRASHILVKLEANASDAQKQAAHQKVLALRQEILGGKLDFADAARKHSDCPSGKENGGDLGPFPYKFAVAEPFARAAFSMKVGEVSDVVVTEFGYHLIKVTNRDNGQPSEYEKIKDQVKEIYAQEIYRAVLTEARRTSRIETFFP